MPSQEILKTRDGTPLEAEGIFDIQKKALEMDRPSREILKIRDGTPLEAEGILTYRKKIPQNGSVWHFSNKLDVPSNVVQKKRVARILVFKIRPSQEILKIRDDVPSNVVQKKRVARILVFKIRPSQEILKIRDGTPLEGEGILTYRKKIPRNGSVWHFSNKLDVPSNVVQKKRVARIPVFKIRPSQEILKIRDGTSLEAEGILTYRKKISRNGSVWHFSNKLDVPSNVVQKKRVARILVFKIRPSQEILKIRDGPPLEAEELLTYRKKSSKWIANVPSNVTQKKIVARILVFKIRPSQEILKIRDGTPLEAEGILTYRKKIPRNGSVWHFFNKLDVPSNVVQKKRVARIPVFKIRPSQEILKIRVGTSLEAEGILTYRKKISRNGSVWHFSNKLDVPSNVVQKKRVARILVFKIRPSQEILKIRDGTPLEAEGLLTYRKKPSKWIVARILVFKIKPSQDIQKIRDDVPSNVVQKKRVARIPVFKIRPSQEILKIRDGTSLEAEGILTYRKKISRNGSVWHFSNKLDVPSNVVQKKRVARILVFKIRPSQEILKIRDGPPLEAEELLTYRKKSSKWIVWHFSRNLDVPSNVTQNKIVARILVFKIRPSQEILKIRDGTPLEAEGILTYRKKIPRNGSVWHFFNKLDVPSNVVQKKRVARIPVFKIRPSQEILKIRVGTSLEAEGILTYRKKISRNGSVWHFSNKLDVPSNVVQKKRVARILVFKIRPSQEILKIRDGTPLEAEGLLTYRKKPSKWIEILKTRDGTPLELDKKRVARIPVFKIRPSQEILKIRDGPPLEAEELLTYRKKPSQEILKTRDGTPLEKKIVARILVFKIRPSQEILKIRDGTPLEAEGILTYRKKIPRNGSVWHFFNKLDVPSNVVQKKRVARIPVFKIRPSQEILKIRVGTSLEAEGILTYRKKISRNGSVWHFSNKLDVPSNVVQKKRVARILVFKIRPSQEILKIRDGTPLEAEGLLTYRKKPSKWIEILKTRDGTPLELDVPSNVVQKKRVARILVFKIRPSQEILKIRDGTPLEAEGILTYRKKIPRNGSVWHFSNKLDVPSNVVQKKRVARIPVFKIRPSQEILKIRDGTSLEAEGILTYRKKISRNGSVWHFSNKLDVPSNVVQKKRVARILVFKIRPSQEILKIRDGPPLEAEELLTYRKKSSKWIEILKTRDDVPSNVTQKKIVARILVFKIRPSQEILKIRDGTPLEAEGILTYRKKIPRNGSVWHFFNKLDVPSNVVQKKRVARIPVFKIRPSQEILKIRVGTSLEAEGILTYRKKISRNGSVWHFSNKLDVPSNVVQKKRVARILVFKIRPSQEILKIRDGTPLEAEGLLTYRKKPSKWIGLALF
ncbi:hypothetical protein OROHE_020361 [Orobanche hederae]